MNVYSAAWYFFIFGFLGYIFEVFYATLKTGKFINRGFLCGPFCPVYGVGVLLVAVVFKSIANRWWLLFLVGGALAVSLELLTGIALDKIFKTKWWDYSEEPFNFKGYICLKFSVLWSVATVAVFYTLVPLSDALISLVPKYYAGIAIIAACFAVLSADVFSSVKEAKKLSDDIARASFLAGVIRKNSEAIGGAVSSVTRGAAGALSALKKKIAKNRIAKAFPNLEKRIGNQDGLPTDVHGQLEKYPRVKK